MNRQTRKTILILGGGTMQLPAIQIARRKGWKVLVADGNPKAAGRDLCDIFLDVDLKDRDGMIKTALQLKEEHALDGVFTAGTDFSSTVAWVAEQLKLPGISYETALNATLKSRMRHVFHKHGIPCPRYTVIGRSQEPVPMLPEGLHYPLVVKPVDNMGARGVKLVNSDTQLNRAVCTARKSSRSGSAVVEEYKSGPELSVDAIIYNDDITICGVADRHICFQPFFVEMGHTMPTDMPRDVVEDVLGVFKQGVRALGINMGAAKGDLKITSEGTVVLEIAARLSGGYMSGWTFPYSTGVEVTEAALNVAVGLQPGDLNPREYAFSAERAFISIPGRISEIEGIQSAERSPDVVNVFLRVNPGSRVVFPSNNVEKCGNVITKADTRKAAVCAAENALKKIFLRLEAGNPETDSFLTSNNHIKAQELRIVENREVLGKMPQVLNLSDTVSLRSGFLCISTLPRIEDERSTDWHGLTLREGLKKVSEITGVQIADTSPDNRWVLGKVFWKAFLKGGVQGGVYIIDTLTQIAGQADSIQRIIKRLSA